MSSWSLLSPLALAVLLSTSWTASASEATECGRISVFDIAPRNQQLFPAVLIAVDGAQPGPSNSAAFRVAPGKHLLTVAERIDTDRFSAVSLAQRTRAGGERYQRLELLVQPGVTYRLAARLDPAAPGAILGNAYWQPVIWSEQAEDCRR